MAHQQGLRTLSTRPQNRARLPDLARCQAEVDRLRERAVSPQDSEEVDSWTTVNHVTMGKLVLAEELMPVPTEEEISANAETINQDSPPDARTRPRPLVVLSTLVHDTLST